MPKNKMSRTAKKIQDAERNHAYYIAHRDEQIAKARAWVIANHEKRANYMRTWRTKHREKERTRHRIYYLANKEKHTVRTEIARIYRIYGLTQEQFDIMVQEQRGLCAICHRMPTRGRLQIDHDHITGKVRKLLCVSCNRALGFFKDNIERLRAAVAYLKEHRESKCTNGV
jgi:hypothetical protein